MTHNAFFKGVRPSFTLLITRYTVVIGMNGFIQPVFIRILGHSLPTTIYERKICPRVGLVTTSTDDGMAEDWPLTLSIMSSIQFVRLWYS